MLARLFSCCRAASRRGRLVYSASSVTFNVICNTLVGAVLAGVEGTRHVLSESLSAPLQCLCAEDFSFHAVGSNLTKVKRFSAGIRRMKEL